jgi:hypothetical protein
MGFLEVEDQPKFSNRLRLPFWIPCQINILSAIKGWDVLNHCCHHVHNFLLLLLVPIKICLRIQNTHVFIVEPHTVTEAFAQCLHGHQPWIICCQRKQNKKKATERLGERERKQNRKPVITKQIERIRVGTSTWKMGHMQSSERERS